jgi:hypothetical protein
VDTMTTDYTARPSIPPIVCAPWCEDGDGHPHERSEGDQVCLGRQFLCAPEVRAGVD